MKPAALPAAAGASHPTLTAGGERALLLTLAAVQLAHIVDFMVVMPLGPQFTQLFGISDAQFGLLVSAYTIAAAASGLAGALFIDRFERRTLLLWTLVAFAAATLLCALAPAYPLLLAARIASGLFGGVLGSLVQTMVGDAIPLERRGRAMGIVMTSFSLATVAGVPASLWLAQALGWQAVFVAIAVASVAIGAIGLRTLPRLDGHLAVAHDGPAWRPLLSVLREPNHWRAFGLGAAVMASGFTAIPFLTIVMSANMGLDAAQVPLVYLAGGVATFFSSRLIGGMADRWGLVRVFRAVAVVAMLPLIAITHLGATPLPALLVVTTAFFVFVSGRMVPGMALITAAARPSLRGTFMSVNGSVQAAAMGLASLAGGLLITRDAAGIVSGYERNGWVAVALTVFAVWWVERLRLPASASASPASAAAAPTPLRPAAPADAAWEPAVLPHAAQAAAKQG